jgi:quinoprotein glucose dehydrogenase
MKACSEEGSFQVLTLAAAFILCAANQAPAQQGVLDGEWRSFGGDPGNTKYSPLDQINRDNFQDLEVAFRWASISTKVTKDNPKIRAGQFKAVPIMIDGVLYVSTALSQVAAIDAGTGETIWEYDPKTYERLRRPANLGWQHKGVAYWEDGDDARIIHTTHDLKLVALNAKSGKLYPGFG